MRCAITVLAACLAFALTFPAQAEPVSSSEKPEDAPRFTLTAKPRWEFGVGLGYIAGQDYPASDNDTQRAIGLPFFIYRGPVLRIGDGGVGAVAVEKPRLRVDLSLGASLNANSADNALRQGMPDLDYLLELGPRLVARLYQSKSVSGARTDINASLKARGVLATDFRGVDHVGWVWGGSINARRQQIFGSRWAAIASLSSLWADRGVHAYFYDVTDEFATTDRTRFESDAGYLGTRLFAGFGASFDKRLRVFAGLRYGSFAGAANRRSPLFETSDSLGAALGIVYTIAESRSRVRVLSDDAN